MKITTETRVIAGVNCRKATGVFNEKFFVVAFFAENIICTGGPEGVTGLPGLILGLAFPSLHITWFATKVDFNTKEKIIKPKSDKNISRKELIDKVLETAKTFNMPSEPVLRQIII